MSIITAEIAKWRQYVINAIADAGGGGSSVSAPYRFDNSTVEADPGNGDFRMDNATPASVTELYVSATTDAGNDLDNILGFVSAGDQIYIQQDNDASKYILFDVAASIDNTGWYTYQGSVSFSGTLFDNNGKCHILILFGGGGSGGSNPGISELNVQNGDYTLVLDDIGKTIAKRSGGAGETYTIPANSAVAYPDGTWIAFDNDGGGDLSIEITTDVLEGTDGATGTRTLGDDERAMIQKIDTTKWRYQATDL